ncbi:nicotinamide N-methyltransferase-like [Spea bombifrons]|uniref:nicotinamide N-methyltransferase-like n=1 Tax=Spea bombifrons TaxID=233779 RepID=UPI00234B4CD6|nr:nicotinamide N-methyltransferase-like [Spea bombifrons]
MDSTDIKSYHVHEFDPVQLLEDFYSSRAEKMIVEEATNRHIEYLYKELSSGHIKGDMLIDFSVGPVISHLLPICEFFKEITVLEFNAVCISELEKWRSSHEEAYDWSHASKYMMDLEGKYDGWQEKEEMLRRKMNRILKCDLTKDNLTDPIVLPKADCIIAAHILNVVSIDKDAYISNLRKITSLLKPGGRLILFGLSNASYYITGGHKFRILTYDEEFVKKVLNDERYTIESFETQDRKTSSHIIDHEKIIFAIAMKQGES